MDSFEFFENIEQDETTPSDLLPMTDSPVYMTNEFCDELKLEESTTAAVQEFIEADENRHPPYGEASIEQRAEYLMDFHDRFNEATGYSNNLHFRESMEEGNLGAFNPETKQIDLNANLLKDSDAQEVMETIMHESRHAFQDFAINHPEQVSVDQETIDTWKYNFANYIRPEFDFEAYESQPVEADANEFSEKMYCEGYTNVA